jgi:hypothetical protein
MVAGPPMAVIFGASALLARKEQRLAWIALILGGIETAALVWLGAFG